MLQNRGIAFRLAFFVLTSCTIIFAAVFGYNYLLSRRIIINNIESNAKDLAFRTVNEIENTILPVEKVPEIVANWLEGCSHTETRLTNVLHTIIANNTNIYGGTIAFEPYSFDTNRLYFSPYFYWSEGKTKFEWIGSPTYDYFHWDWYQIPKELDRPMWSEPYFDEGAGNVIMCTYSVPFYRHAQGERRLWGVVTADISLSWLQKLISSIKIAETGYAFLISRNGTIVTHPRKHFIMNETIFSIAEEMGDERLREIGRDMIKGSNGFVQARSLMTGKKCWLFYAPLPTTGWSLGVLFPQHELMAIVRNLNRTVVALGTLGVLFLTLVIVIIAGSITRPLRILARTTRDIAEGNLDVEMPPVERRDEVGRLAEAFAYMKTALKQYIKDLTETTAAKERMESELTIAHNIQMSIVPKVAPPFVGGDEFDMYAVLLPAREVGGDLYDFFFLDDDRLCFVIGDVSDKGVPAALFMTMTKILIKTTSQHVGNPDEILRRTNDELAADNESCMFVTTLCGILNIRTGEIQYANAGHNPPLLIRGGNSAEYLAVTGDCALGVLEGVGFKKKTLVLRPGDTLFMYTDGVTEAFSKDGELYSEARLKRGVVRHAGDSVKKLVEDTMTDVAAFSKDAPQSDDITILALRYLHRG